MSETRDSAIKLFGRTIPLSKCVVSMEEACEEVKDSNSDPLDPSSSSQPCTTEDLHENDTPKIRVKSKQTSPQKPSLKKPDKLLPCPRCNSTDTKFCYYNNYNVNQPRHFCKNCQRYWTAGGSMRNVPVGAGRRKTKHATSHCRDQNQNQNQDSSHNFLKFGADSPLCESMASLLHLRNSLPEILPLPNLGKHCRDLEEKNVEKSLWIPKTLRIVDQGEAARSSIWAALGIKPDTKAGIFKGSERERVLNLNPAALSRSQTFQEST